MYTFTVLTAFYLLSTWLLHSKVVVWGGGGGVAERLFISGVSKSVSRRGVWLRNAWRNADSVIIAFSELGHLKCKRDCGDLYPLRRIVCEGVVACRDTQDDF